jgi:signal transduction histidine kinase
MIETKEQVAAALARARVELDQALWELDKMPAFEPGAVAYAAHALNNYLTVIDGTTELISTELSSQPNPQVRLWVEGIKHASGMMGQLVAGLMSNATNLGGSQLRLEKVNLALLAERACYYYQRRATPKNIMLHCEASGGPVYVWADRVALAAILDNLLSNAVKYSPAGKPVRVAVAADSDTVVCTVTDEGPGLDGAAQAKLFQKGIRLGTVPTAGEPSTGYGLAVAKELVESLGGRIWCESTIGHGARFSFRVPRFREGPLAETGRTQPSS